LSYETYRKVDTEGIYLSYSTAPGGYHPLHWHEEIELLYQLNGRSDIQIDGEKYQIQNKLLTVIDSRQVHSIHTYSDTSMFICVHISKKLIEKYIPDIDLYRIYCIPDDIPDSQFPEYLSVCRQMEALLRLYITDKPAWQMESEGIILQVLAQLIRHFSRKSAPDEIGLSSADRTSFNRIRDVITYVEEHFREPISLQDIAGHLGLGREYFCRFFKKNMGMSFLRYLNEVRISHVYRDLEQTDAPIAEIAEKNGFLNQKLFNRTFREVYGCTPSAVRRKSKPAE
ncbi:MAG TPA: AraC family transcriptional regulator, partial [Candidatus Merdibacter merdigallinarum]|nr:AraC family transcriptional regulator [Candidatus Merdibacter merdigallinarum]